MNESLSTAFSKAFGSTADVREVIAPGRVNLIGEHTDYNDGFVCPMAIEPHIGFAFKQRDDSILRVRSLQVAGDELVIDLSKPIEPVSPRHNWGNYVLGMAHQLVLAGVRLRGADVMVDATLPKGSGLSSSAAMEVGTGRVLLTVARVEMEGERLALLGQKAEHSFPNVKCGIMDQMIVANGRADHAMLLDCRSMRREYIPLDGSKVRVVIVHSGIGHSLAADENRLETPDGWVAYGTPYNMRRLACETGVGAIRGKYSQVKALRDVTTKMLDEVALREPGSMRFTPAFNEAVYRRCRHVITENARCERFAEALCADRYDEAGQLMYESHRSLMIDYEVSIGPLDVLVTLASGVEGVFGARMTGAGFGGCIVAMVKPDAVDRFTRTIESGYEKVVGLKPLVIATKATDGARVVR
jgi:galactokinase